MDRPLGHACGNALEVEEAIAGLQGNGPPDLMEVTYALGVEMLLAAGIEASRPSAKARLEQALASGAALDKLRLMIEAQGGNPAVVDDPGALPQARHSEVWASPPRRPGQRGGAPRHRPRDQRDGWRAPARIRSYRSVGRFHITVKPGQRVQRGQPLATIHARDEHGMGVGRRALEGAVRFGETGGPLPLISHRVTQAGVESPGMSHQLTLVRPDRRRRARASGWCSAAARHRVPGGPIIHRAELEQAEREVQAMGAQDRVPLDETGPLGARRAAAANPPLI